MNSSLLCKSLQSPFSISVFSLEVMFDYTSNKCQWKIKHTSSLEMMSRNSPCDHRNQTKDMLKAQEYVEAIIQIFQYFKRNGDVHCVTLGANHRVYFSPAQIQGAAVCSSSSSKSSNDAECYIIEVAMKLSMLSNLEKRTKERAIE